MGGIDRKVVFIPGAQKSGTTTLFEVLCCHNDVVRPRIKEPFFFALQQKIVEKHLPWYCDVIYADDSRISIDASNLYLHNNKSPQYIRDYVEDPYVIIVIRNPALRAYSAYVHMNKKIPSADRRSFSDVISFLENRWDREGVDLVEEQIIRKAEKDGVIEGSYLDGQYMKRRYNAPFISEFEDPFHPYRYFCRSMYRERIRCYEEKLGKDRVKVIVFEDMVERPRRIIKEIYDFIGLEEKEGLSNLPHENQTKRPTILGRSVISLMQKMKAVEWLVEQIKSSRLSLLDKSFKKLLWIQKHSMTYDLYDRTRDILGEEYEYWFQKCDRIRSLWVYNG